MVYRPEERWLALLNELELMAKNAGYHELIETMLSIPDTAGRGLISIACENNCPKILRELIKRGACYNQKDSSGATPSYYAFNSKLGREAWRALPYTAEYEYPKREPTWADNIHIIPIAQANIMWQDYIAEYVWPIEDLSNSPPKPKKLKSKLYKQQFGPNSKRR
jgi:hypothetical protein